MGPELQGEVLGPLPRSALLFWLTISSHVLCPAQCRGGDTPTSVPAMATTHPGFSLTLGFLPFAFCFLQHST